MIYMIINEDVARGAGIPQYLIYTSESVSKIPRPLYYSADLVFSFVDRYTVYYKDRYGENRQFTDEEKVVLKLRSVLI